MACLDQQSGCACRGRGACASLENGVAWLLGPGMASCCARPAVLAAEPRARHASSGWCSRNTGALASSAAAVRCGGRSSRPAFQGVVRGTGRHGAGSYRRSGAGTAYAFALDAAADGFVLRFDAAIRAIAEEVAAGADPGRISARFHRTLVDALVAGARRAREEQGLECAVLAGGCFQNAVLPRGQAKRRRRRDSRCSCPSTSPRTMVDWRSARPWPPRRRSCCHVPSDSRPGRLVRGRGRTDRQGRRGGSAPPGARRASGPPGNGDRVESTSAAISRIDEEEAARTLRFLEALGAQFQQELEELRRSEP